MGNDLKGRWFNVGLCLDCWDRLNPDRKASPEQRAEIEAQVAAQSAGMEKQEIADNRCAMCEERIHDGVFVRMNVDTLRGHRRALGYC